MFWLEKWNGKKCYMLAARELTIVWSDSPQYWTWLSVQESQFSEIAYLNVVCWLQIKGMINVFLLSSGTNYATYLVFNMKRNSNGFRDAAVKSWIKIDGDKTTIKKELFGEKEDELESRIYFISNKEKRWVA